MPIAEINGFRMQVFLAPGSAFYRQQPEAVAKAIRDFLSVRQAV